MRIAYLMSQYPAVSHTFFLREILGLRNLDIEIETASVNPPSPDIFITKIGDVDGNQAERTEASTTFYIKQAGALGALTNALRVLCIRPAIFFRGVRAALRLRSHRPGSLLYVIFYFLEALLLGEWMRRRQLRHLHIHFATAVATVGCIAADAYSIPVSLTVHGSDEFFDQSLYALPAKIAQASFILCISHFCRSQLMCLSAPQHWHKLHVVRLGVGPSEYTPIPAHSTPNPAIRLICVGRLVAAKGHLILLESIAQLCERGLNIQLTLVGDGPMRPHLTTFANQHSLTDRIHFAGSCSRNQTRTLLADSDIFVLASFAEGVPVALMEAMAMQLPCISTHIAGIPELIHSGTDGLLVPPSSVDALTSAIETLASDPTLRDSLGTAARTTVDRRYNLNTNLTKLAAVFQRELTREGL